ncbi:hypothetical protein QH294_1917 [Enterococcus faecalis]|nr:hypothetical protein QH294_1917 [Enterococcus faecalis]
MLSKESFLTVDIDEPPKAYPPILVTLEISNVPENLELRKA